MNAFFTSKLSYCPLTWMFHSTKLNNKITGYMKDVSVSSIMIDYSPLKNC